MATKTLNEQITALATRIGQECKSLRGNVTTLTSKDSSLEAEDSAIKQRLTTVETTVASLSDAVIGSSADFVQDFETALNASD